MSDGGERSFNENVIAEFRANGGRLGGMFAGKPLLLLTTRGARSGGRTRPRWSTWPTARAC
ncbi:nitroreductase/quinone reductase family protein [Thermocatellispora tengchongensis]|uniref:nitroreductase/quinone reductase family protein n=1 Tax=Thermocatellispora tengchongensis TaxID=1073253 RepID=UPI003639CFFB